jgi:predicted dienelactone hydrolase
MPDSSLTHASLTDSRRLERTRRSASAIPAALWIGALLGCFSWLPAPAANAAERVYISYSILERSIPIASLETYARQGTIDEALEVYTQYAKPDELVQLRRLLQTRAEISPVALSQFLYSPQGEILLQRLGQVIQSESRLSGFNAIRAALILAAADPEGLTLLNLLRKFPTRGIRIDVEGSLAIAAALEGIVNQTNRANAAVAQAAAVEAATAPRFVLTSAEPDLRRRGTLVWNKQTLSLIDLARSAFVGTAQSDLIQSPALQNGLRGRLIAVDVYLPSLAGKPAPVVVISHGLGSDRNTFTYLAEHLASHGFAVLVPEHPGSNAEQFQALLRGTASGIAQPAEFVDRPLDITFVLDQMERSTNPAIQGRMNLQQVGVIGQSFGGYTALAVGGAPINAKQLQADCQTVANTLNISLLLQCDAARLVQATTQLRDQRVKAIIGINPITSAVFGQEGIRQIPVPTMLIAGGTDTVAPALSEQIQPFTWLMGEKYLALMQTGTHFSTIAAPNGSTPDPNAIALPPGVIGPNPAIARRYLNALSLAFFQTYLTPRSARPFLSAAYAQSISEPAMPLNLIQAFTPEQLAEALKRNLPPSSPASTAPTAPIAQ